MYQKICVNTTEYKVTNTTEIENAYREALCFTKSHYENFPVVSFFIPKELRKHIAVVYKFARQADDIADEGNNEIEQRIQQLSDYKQKLSDALNQKFYDGFWSAFYNTVTERNLPPQNFFDLLSAFEQDITKTRYNNFSELLNYCTHSANPVGRIILDLFNISDNEAIKYSDAVCTALQLTNFLQDTAVDYSKGRIYLPLDEMKNFGVEENIFRLKENNSNFMLLLKHQIGRIDGMFDTGKKLLVKLPSSLKYQIKMTILGGKEILRKIEKNNYDVLNVRPALTKADFINLLLKSFTFR
ncbi:MAG: squalene synthase HpnC [Ignavibacteriales bacterium]|nr:squalene synthase HpnC [Ignavibacteriales bacterium]